MSKKEKKRKEGMKEGKLTNDELDTQFQPKISKCNNLPY